MHASRRSMLATAGASLQPVALGASANGPDRSSAEAMPDRAVAELLRLSLDSNAALMRGDIAAYRALLEYTADFTLMSPFGGAPTHGADMTEDTWARMGRFFRHGTFGQELVQAYAAADMVVLALIERPHVEVGGLPAQEWALRVTLVYRREGDAWRLAHRHADPLVAGVSWAEAAVLARGERAP